MPGEQQECLALLISLVLFVYWGAWLVCVSGCLKSNRTVQCCLFPKFCLFIGVLGLFVFQGTWRVPERFSIACFPSLFIGVFVFQGTQRATRRFSVAYYLVLFVYWCVFVSGCLESNRKLHVIPGGRKGTEKTHMGHTACVLSMAITSDGKFLVCLVCHDLLMCGVYKQIWSNILAAVD